MGGLLYRENIDEARTRLTTWWNGGDVGRPAMHSYVGREAPLEQIEPLPPPDTSAPGCTTKDFAFRLNQSARACCNTWYLGEAVHALAPRPAPDCPAPCPGGKGVGGNGRARWWLIYHKTLQAGKKLLVGRGSIENLKALKKEFGADLKQFLIGMGAESKRQAEEILKIAEV